MAYKHWYPYGQRRKYIVRQSFKDIVNSEDDHLAIKEAIFDEIYTLHHCARRDKPADIEDYNVNDPTAKRYRLLLSAWWSLPGGLPFVVYNINKGITFGAPCNRVT